MGKSSRALHEEDGRYYIISKAADRPQDNFLEVVTLLRQINVSQLKPLDDTGLIGLGIIVDDYCYPCVLHPLLRKLCDARDYQGFNPIGCGRPENEINLSILPAPEKLKAQGNHSIYLDSYHLPDLLPKMIDACEKLELGGNALLDPRRRPRVDLRVIPLGP